MKTGRFYIYGLFADSNPNKLAYVGCSGSLMARYETHINGRDPSTGDWVRSVQGVVRLIILESCPNKPTGLEREKWWIQRLLPPCNQVYAQPPILAPDVLAMIPQDDSRNARLRWIDGDKYFGSVMGAAEYFGWSSSPFRAKLRQNNGVMFSPRLGREVQFEILDESLR